MEQFKHSVKFYNTFLLSSVMAFLTPGTINDFMRSIGKIWVVVATLLIIFVGIVIFMFFVEKRISKLENELDNE